MATHTGCMHAHYSRVHSQIMVSWRFLRPIQEWLPRSVHGPNCGNHNVHLSPYFERWATQLVPGCPPLPHACLLGLRLDKQMVILSEHPTGIT
jgi:hypothetical protein